MRETDNHKTSIALALKIFTEGYPGFVSISYFTKLGLQFAILFKLCFPKLCFFYGTLALVDETTLFELKDLGVAFQFPIEYRVSFLITRGKLCLTYSFVQESIS